MEPTRMESLFIDEVQQEKTIGRWGSEKRRKVLSVLGVMAALLVISVIFITLYVSEERRCTPCDAQKAAKLDEIIVIIQEKLDTLDKSIANKLDLVNKSNEELSSQVKPMSQRLTTLEKHGKLDAMNKTIEALSKSLESLDKNTGRKLDLVNKSNTELSSQIKPMSQRIMTLENHETLDTMKETIEALSKRVDSLDKVKLDLVNKSDADLFVQLQAMYQLLKVAMQRQVGAHYALLFPRKGTSDYVTTRGMPSLKAVTVCLWITTNDTGNSFTPVSYAVQSGSANELLLTSHRIRNLNFFVRGRSSGSQINASANDGKWHHICATWENTAGSWKLFKDGRDVASGRGLQTGLMIRGGGVLVLGHDQDSIGGRFQASQSFIGEMTGVNIWDHVITDQEITRMSTSCLTEVGNVYQWRDFKAHLKGSVQIIKPSC